MEFYKINEGGVRRDDGVNIQIKHHDYLLYQIGDRSIEVSMGYEPSAREIYVYASEVQGWDSPNDSDSFTEADRKIFIDNLKQGLGLLKGNFVLK